MLVLRTAASVVSTTSCVSSKTYSFWRTDQFAHRRPSPIFFLVGMIFFKVVTLTLSDKVVTLTLADKVVTLTLTTSVVTLTLSDKRGHFDT